MPDHIPSDIRRFFQTMSTSERLRFKNLLEMPEVRRIIRASQKRERIDAYVAQVHANVEAEKQVEESTHA